MSKYNYKRRNSSETKVGHTAIGGNNPIRLQSMTNTSTLDTEGCVKQAIAISEAGGELVRLTTQGVREAANISEIKKELQTRGYDIPLVADVHFNPAAAFKATETCEKVRINPGNFVDAARTFKKLTFTEAEYAHELDKIEEALIPFIELCKKNNTAIRLGVNHGSLSDRIMSRYGDTPKGMVISVLEFLRVFEKYDFHDIVISIKASNVVVMVDTVRLLVETMNKENMKYPLHLGVTEAGDGEDGRIKSAVGIGTLLAEGLGDTIRVSLTENPENEIPVAKMLRDYIVSREGHPYIEEPESKIKESSREYSLNIPFHQKDSFPVVGLDITEVPKEWIEINCGETNEKQLENIKPEDPVIVTSKHINAPGEIAAWIDNFQSKGNKNPIILKFSYDTPDIEKLRIQAAADMGFLLLNGYGDAVLLDSPGFSQDELNSIVLGILQACRLRISKTEYIACPSCGRTLFDLQKVLHEVRESTKALKGLKIGVMGCIVNGPGEMADADYGYVGAGVGKVSLYKGKTLVEKNIPAESAIEALIELIKRNGDWKE